MSNVLIDKNKIDILANAIAAKSGEPLTLTLEEMVEAVDGIETGGGGATPILQAKTYNVSSAGTSTVTADSGYDGLSEVEVTVPLADPWIALKVPHFYTENNQRKWQIKAEATVEVGEGDTEGWLPDGFAKDTSPYTCNAIPSGTTITPTTSSQTIGGANYMMEGAVTVSAMPSGTAGTPTATKGAVSNHTVSVTPSVTNTTGYITGSTKTGTAVTVSASELVSGSETKTANGTYDVTNLAQLVVNVSGGSSDIATGTLTVASNVNTSTSTQITNTTTIGFTPTKFFFYRSDRSATSNHVNQASFVTLGTSYYVRTMTRYSSNALSTSGNTNNWTTQTAGYLYFNSNTIYFRSSSSYILPAGTWHWVAVK